jgi:predicted ArsR family transcriptional regulator
MLVLVPAPSMSSSGSISAAKRRLLDELKLREPATVSQLADVLELTEVAVRQHLAALEAEGLVAAAPGPTTARGRPPVAWTVTDAARALFPDHHAQLAVEIIDAIRVSIGDDGLRRVIDARAEAQVDAYQRRIPVGDATIRARVGALARLRTDEGYLAEAVRESPDSYLLIERHCPICEAATACTGICRAEWDVFRRVLGDDLSVERIEHLIAGDTRCAYRIRRRSAEAGSETGAEARASVAAR